MSDIRIVFGIIAAVVVLFVRDRLPVIAVRIGAAISLSSGWSAGPVRARCSRAWSFSRR